MANQKAGGTRKSIIMTGGSGFLGTALAKSLRDEFDIFVLDIKEPEDEIADDVRFIDCDLTDDSSVRGAIGTVSEESGEPVASVIHLAAYYDFSGEPSDLYDQITVKGTERLLRALQDLKVEQFVFSSTMLVHKAKDGKITEDDPLEGNWDYPRSKIETEKVIHENRGSIPAVMLRIAGVYTDECRSIPLAHQIQRIREEMLTSHVFPGDTSKGQAFVHIEDLVDAVVRTVRKREELPVETAILIGEPETPGYDELQRTLGQLIHGQSEWTTEQIPKAVAKSGAWVQDKVPGIEEPFIKPWMIDLADDHYELDISRAKELLGWEPKHRLIDTLPKMVETMKSDPAAWYEKHDLDPPENKDDPANAPAAGAKG